MRTKAAAAALIAAAILIDFSTEAQTSASVPSTALAESYRKSAEHGDPEAQLNLGMCYWTGKGALQNPREAVKWFRKAANQGNANAQYQLGSSYYSGQGLNMNQREAARWLRKAADQGNADAECDLGVCYNHGQGVSQDDIQAVQWFRKAAEQGSARGELNLGLTYYNRQSGVQVVDVEREHLDQREAVLWFRKAADKGDDIAQCCLGICYYKQEGVTLPFVESKEEAVRWFHKAADQGNARAEYYLGICAQSGFGLEKDENQDVAAAKWFHKSADQGHFYAKQIIDQIAASSQPGSERPASPKVIFMVPGADSPLYNRVHPDAPITTARPRGEMGEKSTSSHTTVELKDNTFVSGRILSEAREAISIDTGGTVLFIPREKVRMIVMGRSASDTGKVSPEYWWTCWPDLGKTQPTPLSIGFAIGEGASITSLGNPATSVGVSGHVTGKIILADPKSRVVLMEPDDGSTLVTQLAGARLDHDAGPSPRLKFRVAESPEIDWTVLKLGTKVSFDCKENPDNRIEVKNLK